MEKFKEPVYNFEQYYEHLCPPGLKANYRKEFLRRCFKLFDQLSEFIVSGCQGSLFPLLFSVFTYLWSSRKIYKGVLLHSYDQYYD